MTVVELVLDEAKWDPADHPRWPKGTPRGGEFIKVGQLFDVGGKTYEVGHVFKGQVVAHRAHTTKASQAETRVFDVSKTSGPADVLGGITAAAPKAVVGGKKGSNVTVVDPYVDSSTHDPSIPLPQGSQISPEEWQRFGRIDQLHYVDLHNRIGPHDPKKAQGLIHEAYSSYDDQTAKLVKSAYSEQYGSSTGFTLSITGMFKKLLGKSDTQLQTLTERRERAHELIGRLRDVYAWDLYNRTRSPDVAVFHKDHGHDPAWWTSQFITGDRPLMSGLSQSFHYRQSFFGPNAIATPMAIRHVAMSTYTADPVPNSFHSELEIASAHQLAVDDRSVAFAAGMTDSTHLTWLNGVTQHPQGGHVVERLIGAMKSGEKLPIPPQPPKIDMTEGFPQPPPAAINPPFDAAGLPTDYSQPVDPAALPKDAPWAHIGPDGNPQAEVALNAGFQAGDYMVGLKGTLYWVGPDASDPSGFGLRYHKLVPDGKGGWQFNDENYLFDGGGKNSYYRIDANVPLPPPPALDPFVDDNWAKGTESVFVSEMEKGTKFKVNGTPYEVMATTASKAAIVDLSTGLKGTINGDYKGVPLVPLLPDIKAAKGMTFAHEGKKHIITNVLKDGTVRAKPQGGKVMDFAADHEALKGLYDPTSHVLGPKTKLTDLGVGSLFHGGRGSVQRPYRVLGQEGAKVRWRNLDTGEEGTSLGHRVVPILVPDVEQQQPPPLAHVGDSPPGTVISPEPGTKVKVTGKLDGDEHVVDVLDPASGETIGQQNVAPSMSGPVAGTTTPPPIDLPQHDGLLNAVDAGFEPYKWHKGGGGQQYEKLGDLGVGTVIADKKGKHWKVKAAHGADVVLSDGYAEYLADPKLRGLVVDLSPLLDPGGDATLPPIPTGIPEDFQTNVTGTTLEHVAAAGGGHVLLDGQVLEVSGPPTAPVLTSVQSGLLIDYPYPITTVPDAVAYAAPTEPKKLIDLQPGEKVGNYEIIAHASDGTTVVKGPDGLVKMASGWWQANLEKAPAPSGFVDAPPDVAAASPFPVGTPVFTPTLGHVEAVLIDQGNGKPAYRVDGAIYYEGELTPAVLSALPPGAHFPGPDGEIYEVVAHTSDGTTIVRDLDGALHQLSSDQSV